MTHTRPAQFAGKWYEGDAQRLAAAIEHFLSTAEEFPDKTRGAVLPHAGHPFSGRGIAPFFKNSAPGIRWVIILAPSHYAVLPPERVGYGSFDEYETPLGAVPAMVDPFRRDEIFQLMDGAVAAEHSAEMFLPFIKYLLSDAAATILLVPRVSDETVISRFADAIDRIIPPLDREKVAFIASSDFTHYGTRFDFIPFGTRDVDLILSKTAALDRKYADLLARHERARVLAERRRDEPTICGLDPALVLSALMERRNLTGTIAGYYTSCDILGKSSDFVCYMTILYH